jgi:hypothetical protein
VRLGMVQIEGSLKFEGDPWVMFDSSQECTIKAVRSEKSAKKKSRMRASWRLSLKQETMKHTVL